MGTSKGSYNRIDFAERKVIENMLRQKCGIREIAKLLSRSPGSICKEIKRGSVSQIDPKTSCHIEKYFAEYAQNRANRLKTRIGNTKISADSTDAQVIEKLIKEDGFSPYAALIHGFQIGSIKTRICTKTVYNYIHTGLLNITSLDLPQGFNHRAKKKIPFNERRIYDKAEHVSIEKRPINVLSRKEFGHWEGDTIVSRTSKKAIFTMVERKSRYLFAVLLPNKKQSSIVEALDKIEASVGNFDPTSVFKTLTLDNGIEFFNTKAMMTSYKGNTKRIGEIFYSHAFSSFERGSNEVIHRFLRRKWPRSADFSKIEESEVLEFVEWVNEYPRKIFNGNSARDIFLPLLGSCPRAA